MHEKHFVSDLAPEEQRTLKRGRCPWDGSPTVDATLYGREGDQCSECSDEFVGALTIED